MNIGATLVNAMVAAESFLLKFVTFGPRATATCATKQCTFIPSF